MSKDSKRKWEKDYEEYKSRSESEGEAKPTTPEEYRKAEVEKKIRENLPKVEKIIQTKKTLTERLEKLIQDKEKYDKGIERKKELGQQEKQLEEEASKLDEEITKLASRRNEIYDLMMKASPEEKAKLEEELKQNQEVSKKNEGKYGANREKFNKNQEELKNMLTNSKPEKDYDKKIQTTKNMISKCNFIGKNLMQGKRMDDITVDLKNWKDRSFTDKSKETKTKTEASKTEKKGSAPVKHSDKEHHEEKNIKDTLDNDKPKKDENKDNKPAKISEFFEKHPRLAKIKNFFVKTFNTVKNKLTKKDAKDIEEKAGKLTPEQIAERKAEFYKRLAETGKFGKDPVDSKITQSLKSQDEIVKNNEDEGR